MNHELKLPCEDKLVFDTKEQATATALTAKWQHGTRLVVYRCKDCRLWHLSSKSS